MKTPIVHMKDFKIVDVPDESVNVIGWAAPGADTASEVHILVLTPVKVGFSIRLHSREHAEKFIAELLENVERVWPES